MTPVKVLDSFAVIAFLEDEPGADKVRELILQAEEGKSKLSMSVVNLGEVWYAIARAESPATADRLVAELRGMAIEIVDVDWSLTREAAVLKARGKASYADCFAAALARLRKAEVVTGDPEFKNFGPDVKVARL